METDASTNPEETHGADHEAVLDRLAEASPPFRPEASPQELVDAFADGETRFPAFIALCAHGEAALPAIRAGLGHGDWHVRHWCAIYLDHHADAESLEALLPLLRDPKSQVRLWAVHSISCEACKDEPNEIDVIPLLIERIEVDESIRVRRHAVAMLSTLPPDARAVPVLKRLLESEEDAKLRLHAGLGLERYLEAGLGR